MYNYNDLGGVLAILGVFALVLVIFIIAFLTVYLVALCKLFKKCGRESWEAIVPFYNTYVLVNIAGLNWWYFLIAISGSIVSVLGIEGLSFLTNIASAVAHFFIFYNLAKKMHKEPVGYAVASIFVAPIVTMIMGFSKDYVFDNSVKVSPNGPINDNKGNNVNNNANMSNNISNNDNNSEE